MSDGETCMCAQCKKGYHATDEFNIKCVECTQPIDQCWDRGLPDEARNDVCTCRRCAHGHLISWVDAGMVLDYSEKFGVFQSFPQKDSPKSKFEISH